MILFFIMLNNYETELISYKQTKQPWLYSVIKKGPRQANPWVINQEESNEKLSQYVFPSV